MFRIITRSFSVLSLCLALCLFSSSNLWATSAVHEADLSVAIWPSQLSDLSSDPSLIRGVLSNGFRYVIKKNSEPENRVAAYLAVLSGSMEEKDNEQGVAHFLEHLMFNGSTHFPPGTLIDYFQSIGMDFGGDTNAYTGFDKTVYHLILPNGNESDLEMGCKILADYARGALLLDSEIDRERGVIFSEKRSRDSASYRNYIKYSDFAFEGTRYPLRSPIGKASVLKTADHSLLKGYYDLWYRPENMVLVLVGDLDTETAKRVVSGYFDTLKSDVPRERKPAFGALERTGTDVFYNYTPELGKTNVSIETFWDIVPKIPLKIDEQEDLIQIIGNIILRYRLQQAQEKTTQPYAVARYSAGVIAKRIGYGSIQGVTDAASWKATLKTLYETIESTLIYGFTDREITRAKKELLAELEENIQTESTLHSRVIAERLVNHLVDGEVYMSPEQEWELYKPMLDTLTVKDINNGFNKIWSKPNRLISVSGDVNLGNDGQVQIKRLYQTITKKTIEQPTAEQEVRFPYLAFSQDVPRVKEKKFYPDLGATRYTFENGLVVNLKKTPFEKNKIRVVANFGKGKQEETRAGMSIIADDVINLSGSNKLSVSELESVIAGSSVDVSFKIGRESSSWTGATLSKDTDLFFQVLQTLVLDAGFEEVAFKKVKRRLKLMYNKLDNEIQGAVLRKVQPFLAGNNMQYGLPSYEDINMLTYVEVQNWVKRHLKIKDLQLSVVGDFDEKNLLSIIQKYFGSLQLQNPPARISDENIKFPEGGRITVHVPSEIKKSTIFLSWPTDDFWDIGQTRRLSILAAVIEDRMRKVVREKLGASYSPLVTSYGSRSHHNYGYIQIEVSVESGKEEFLAGQITQLVKDLVVKGVSDDELVRAKKPVSTAVLENIKTNQYWLYSVLALSASHPEQLEWPATIVDDINSINTTDLDELAKQYLQDGKVAIAIVEAGADTTGEK